MIKKVEWKIGRNIFRPCGNCRDEYDRIVREQWKEKQEKYGEKARQKARKQYLKRAEQRAQVIAALTVRPKELDREEWGEDGTCFCACGGVSGNYVDRCKEMVFSGGAYLIGADEVGQALLRGKRVGDSTSSGLARAIELWGEPWGDEKAASEWRKHMGVYCASCYMRAAKRRTNLSMNIGCWHDIHKNRTDHPYPIQRLEAYFF